MNKHKATDSNGKVHTRNSRDRLYTHTVVGRRDFDRDRKRAGEIYPYDLESFAYYKGKGDARVEGFPDAKAFAQAEAEKRVAALDARKETFKEWGNLGWCGRKGLTAAVINAHRKNGFTEFEVLEASVKS